MCSGYLSKIFLRNSKYLNNIPLTNISSIEFEKIENISEKNFKILRFSDLKSWYSYLADVREDMIRLVRRDIFFSFDDQYIVYKFAKGIHYVVANRNFDDEVNFDFYLRIFNIYESLKCTLKSRFYKQLDSDFDFIIVENCYMPGKFSVPTSSYYNHKVMLKRLIDEVLCIEIGYYTESNIFMLSNVLRQFVKIKLLKLIFVAWCNCKNGFISADYWEKVLEAQKDRSKFDKDSLHLLDLATEFEARLTIGMREVVLLTLDIFTDYTLTLQDRKDRVKELPKLTFWREVEEIVRLKESICMKRKCRWWRVLKNNSPAYFR